MTSKILVPVDGSASASKAAQLAAEWASKMGCTVTLLHVHDPKIAPNGDVFGPIEKIFAQKGLKVRTRLSKGLPAEEICATAKAGSYDLVIMGSRGLSDFKKLFIGSVSSRVAANAGCPVTIVQ